MKLRPAGLAMTCEEVVPVLMEVGRGMVMTGSAWLRAICCWAKGVSSVGGAWGCCCWAIVVKSGPCGVGVTEGVRAMRVLLLLLKASAGCGVEQGVLVGVGVEGFGVPDPGEGGERRQL